MADRNTKLGITPAQLHQMALITRPKPARFTITERVMIGLFLVFLLFGLSVVYVIPALVR